MKSNFLRFSFIASALSLCLGIPGQARAADSGCDGRSSIHRKIVWGDTLSAIAKDTYGNGTRKFYLMIADANNIADPNLIIAGRTLSIPCLAQTVEITETLPLRSMEQAELEALNAISIEDLPSPNLSETARDIVSPYSQSETFAQRKLEAQVEVSVPAPIAESKSIEPLAPAPVPAPLAAKQANAKPGIYELQLGADTVSGIAAGQFPAFYLEGQEKSGLWRKRIKTTATIRATDDGNFLVDVVFKTIPSAHSAVAFDLGEGNLVQIGGEMISANGNLVTTKATAKARSFKKKDYTDLDSKFVQKSSRAMAVVRKITPIAIPAALGFAFGGPVGAAFGGGVPFARSIIASKIERMRQPPSEDIAPHVQNVMSSQADEIERLKQQLADQQQQIDRLKGNLK